MKNLKEDKVLVKGHVARAWLIVTGQDPSAKPGHFPAGLSSLFQGPDLPLDRSAFLTGSVLLSASSGLGILRASAITDG